jgi:MazG family protein
MNLSKQYAGTFTRLAGIMDELRTQCPWDQKQTIETLRQLTIEEMYELADAISQNNWQGIKEELGDLLLHIFFYTKIAAEKNIFGMEDVVEAVCNKLVHRHPHIYSSVKVENEEDVKRNWENLKLKEGKKGVLSGVPLALPAMIKALRLQEKSKQVGFEWEVTDQVKNKLLEELDELQEVIDEGNKERIKDEFGDVLFSMINYARFLQIDPEDALEHTNRKFKRRFELMEADLTKNNKALTDYSLAAMNEKWNEVKRNEQKE